MVEKNLINSLKTDELQPIVILDNVTKIYGKTNWIIKKVSLTINKGDCIALVGDNNAGKSILAKLIGNQISQTAGIIDYFFEEDNIFKAVGYQEREQSWPGGFKVKDILLLYLAIYEIQDKAWIDKLKDTFNVDEIINKPLNKLSIINLQLFAMFLVILHKPELLIIDEMSSSIGFETRTKIINLFKEYLSMGNSMLIVTPEDFSINALCTRIITMNAGEIQDDMLVNDVIKQYGSTFEYMRSTVDIIKTIKRKKKIDPTFEPLIRKYSGFYKNLMDHYNTNFKDGFNSGDIDFDILIKNTIYYINVSKEKMLETISSNIMASAVNETEKLLIKTQKNNFQNFKSHCQIS